MKRKENKINFLWENKISSTFPCHSKCLQWIINIEYEKKKINNLRGIKTIIFTSIWYPVNIEPLSKVYYILGNKHIVKLILIILMIDFILFSHSIFRKYICVLVVSRQKYEIQTNNIVHMINLKRIKKKPNNKLHNGHLY